jgi:hypothetical protein
MKNRMREICSSGSVRGGGGNVPTYSAECQPERGILARFDKLAESSIAIDLQRAAECRQVLGRMLASAVLGVDVGCRRMSGSGPRPIIDRIAPQTPGLGLASAGIEHRQGRLIGEQLVR